MLAMAFRGSCALQGESRSYMGSWLNEFFRFALIYINFAGGSPAVLFLTLFENWKVTVRERHEKSGAAMQVTYLLILHKLRIVGISAGITG